MYIQNDILNLFNNQSQKDLIYTNMMKAFDRINHK